MRAALREPLKDIDWRVEARALAAYIEPLYSPENSFSTGSLPLNMLLALSCNLTLMTLSFQPRKMMPGAAPVRFTAAMPIGLPPLVCNGLIRSVRPNEVLFACSKRSRFS